jgi:hypothetical protein
MMSEEKIRIERIRVGELENFARSMISSIGQDQLLPITLQRAIAHAHNPYADKDDIGLLLAYIGEECVGYFGILPIMLKHENKFSKVYWFSTWLVSPKYRGRSIGSHLMKDALSISQDYLIVGSGPARKVCRKFDFHELPPLIYYSLDMSGMRRLNPITWFSRLFRKILSPFGLRVQISNDFTKLFENFASPLTKKFFYWLAYQLEKCEIKAYRYNEVDEISNHGLVLDDGLPRVSFYRGYEAINWMLKYPWVVESGQSPTEKIGFYFTDVRRKFFNRAIEVYSREENNYKGFVIMSFSMIGEKFVLKILDMHFLNKIDVSSVLPLAIHYGRNLNADRIELPKDIGDSVKSGIIRKLLLNEKLRIYQCHPGNEHSPLGQWWQEIELNYCDGDMPFT